MKPNNWSIVFLTALLAITSLVAFTRFDLIIDKSNENVTQMEELAQGFKNLRSRLQAWNEALEKLQDELKSELSKDINNKKMAFQLNIIQKKLKALEETECVKINKSVIRNVERNNKLLETINQLLAGAPERAIALPLMYKEVEKISEIVKLLEKTYNARLDDSVSTFKWIVGTFLGAIVVVFMMLTTLLYQKEKNSVDNKSEKSEAVPSAGVDQDK